MTRHVAVIGAGIVGVSTALWLQRDGVEVTLIDRAGPGEGTSFGNGGVLASCSVVPVTTPGLLRKAPGMLFDANQPLFLKWRYLPRLLPWLIRYLRHANAGDAARIAKALTPVIGDSLADHQALAHGTPAAQWITPCDYLYLYRDRAAYDADAFGWGLRRQNGFDWEELEGPDLAAYDPLFAPHLGFATKMAGHGRITDPGRYVKDLAAHFQAQGGRLLTAEVTGIVQESGAVAGVSAAGTTIPCTDIALTSGVWSGPLAAQLGVTVPMETERGYHIELWDPSMMPRAPVMIADGKFVATPMEGRLRLAGIVEFGGLKAPASDAPFDLLLRQVRRALPGLTWKEESRWMGHRPAPADSIPLIGPAPRLKGAFMGFGHHHIGLTGGPKTGRLLSQIITGAHPNIDLTPYAPSRFAAA